MCIDLESDITEPNIIVGEVEQGLHSPEHTCKHTENAQHTHPSPGGYHLFHDNNLTDGDSRVSKRYRINLEGSATECSIPPDWNEGRVALILELEHRKQPGFRYLHVVLHLKAKRQYHEKRLCEGTVHVLLHVQVHG